MRGYCLAFPGRQKSMKLKNDNFSDNYGRNHRQVEGQIDVEFEIVF